jgi:four helix bundle protein
MSLEETQDNCYVDFYLCLCMHLHLHVFTTIEVYMNQLSHEKLNVYQKAIEFLAIAIELIESIPSGNSTIIDQLKRASISIVLNIAEGAGHPSLGKRQHHYAIARGSALECGSILDVCKILEAGKQNLIPQGKETLVSVVAMLSKMCRL